MAIQPSAKGLYGKPLSVHTRFKTLLKKKLFLFGAKLG